MLGRPVGSLRASRWSVAYRSSGLCAAVQVIAVGACSAISHTRREHAIQRLFFFFQAEDGIRDWSVTGVQTCALPIYRLCASNFQSGTRRGSEEQEGFTRQRLVRVLRAAGSSENRRRRIPGTRHSRRERRSCGASHSRSEERRVGKEGKSLGSPSW